MIVNTAKVKAPAAPRASISIESPIGLINIEATDEGITAIHFADPDGATAHGSVAARRNLGEAAPPLDVAGVAQQAADEIAAYLGQAHTLFTTPIATLGTAFQRRVWDFLRTIPAGETMSYGAVAAAVGSPGASRAVGMACGRNPIPIIVPCHRVVAADGSLHGFSAGLWRKEWLLEHESVSGRGSSENLWTT